ncbi:MAG: hypothetical protein GX594_01665 [Pirellulaceae bacterium]|nr:hypothetical protein [Pirellulaceae bacterium]
MIGKAISFIAGSVILIALACPPMTCVSAAAAAEPASEQEQALKLAFIKLCDANAQALDKQAVDRVLHSWGCFDSYVARALAAAYDLEGKQEYLAACKRWSDQTLEFQKGMIPKGAYYMHYGRKPGEDKGKWYVADSSCIAMGVLATAVRCDDPEEKAKYLDSVKAFYRLVADNWVLPSGGVANGHWPKSDKEYWCAAGTFGSLAFLLYRETGDEECLKIGLGTIDWLNKKDLQTVAYDHYEGFVTPSVLMFCLESYSAGLPHLKPGGPRYKDAMRQLAKAQEWITQNGGGQTDAALRERGVDPATGKVDKLYVGGYLSQRGSKLGGLPFHLMVQSKWTPDGEGLTLAADKELIHIAGVLKDAPPTCKLAAFTLMSLAEKFAPGKIYRTSSKQDRR